MTADNEGAHSLLELLPLLEAAPGEHRTITISAPTTAVLGVPNFRRGDAKWAAPTKWQLRCDPASDSWYFPIATDIAQLSFGSSYLQKLADAFRGIPRGKGDFSIGVEKGGSQALWFWWHPNAA
jgi:hypothetical protein